MATEAGVQFASKLLGPVLYGASVPAGAWLTSRGMDLRNAASVARSSMDPASDITDVFTDKFGKDAVKEYKKFDTSGETYKQWRLLRKKNFLEPYIEAGVSGLNMPVGRKAYAVDVIKTMRKLVKKWNNSQERHYGAFSSSPRAAFEVLAREGMEESHSKNLSSSLDGMLNEYDALAVKHGPYHAFYKLYQQPWAKVNLSNQKSVDEYVKQYGHGSLVDAKRKQALLFHASKSKLFAPKPYGLVNHLVSGLGLGMESLGAGMMGVGGYRGVSGLMPLLKHSALEDVKEAPPPEGTPDSLIVPPEVKDALLGPIPDAAKAPTPVTAVTDLVSGANPFSKKMDVMGITYKPRSKGEELARVIPSIVGKTLVGAAVMPAIVRSVVEAVRGATKQGPYAHLGRLHGMGTGALLGLGIPIKALISAVATQGRLGSIAKGKILKPEHLKALAASMHDAPLRSSEFASKAIPALSRGEMIPAALAEGARKDLFEQNATTVLNAILGGSITGYAGYSSYKRGKGIRDAFEELYGKNLPPDVAQEILNPARMKTLAKFRKAKSMIGTSPERTHGAVK
jgi:hypothetical protein